MLNFDAFRNQEMTLNELIAGLAVDDLHRLTGEMIDRMLGLITGCSDSDVVFPPHDPEANDLHTTIPEEITLPWTMGHIIVHVTATSEEAAALAAEMARGVPLHGRSRYEISWRGVLTVEQCRERLEESRRMRQASLEMWPRPPRLEVTIELWAGMGRTNAVGRFVLGLMHDDDHLAQMAEVIRQAHADRRG